MSVAACVLVLALSGCSSEPRNAAPAARAAYPNWPPTLTDFRFRWTAEPGIDLLSGAAVPIRAYMESRKVAEFTAVGGNRYPTEFESYPGFRNAVRRPTGTPMQGPDPVEVWYAYPRLDNDVARRPLHGNEYFHLLELEPIDEGYRAYVCDGRYGVFTKRGDEKTYEWLYLPDTGKYDYVHIWRVEVHHPGDLPRRAPQRGPNPAPVEDVFGAVKVFASDRASWGGLEGQPFTDARSRDENRISEENHRRCLDRLPDSLHDMGVIAAQRPVDAPAVGPAVPGWPAQVG